MKACGRKFIQLLIKLILKALVYIMASGRNGTIYIGVSNNLTKRVWEHKNNVVKGFTDKYLVHKLIYYEMHSDIQLAIKREKLLKKWNRQWKLELIEKENPQWHDLYEKVFS